jgi:hypothetical protein
MNSALSDNTDAENHQTEDISHPPVHFLSSASDQARGTAPLYKRPRYSLEKITCHLSI